MSSKKIVIFTAVGLTIFALLDLFNIDALIRNLFPQPIRYDLPFLTTIGSVGTILAALVAYYAINKQLAIEQEPYVVLTKNLGFSGIDRDDSGSDPKEGYGVTILNVGRGSAIRVTVNTSKNNPDKAFFRDDQDHSTDLASGKEKRGWLVDKNLLKKLVLNKRDNPKEKIELYIHYSDQLNNKKTTRVRLSCVSNKSYYKVMENERLK